MTEFVLKNNYFKFNGQVKQQISGTAIGIKFAPTYVCIFMDDVESKFLKTQSLQPLIWFRYIDDVFFIWTHGEEKLQLFLTDLNNYNLHIEFTYEFNKEYISFLDLKFSLCDDKLTTDLHVKPTDRNQYLHDTSAHPNHTKRSIVYSQTLRLSRICSYKNGFEKHLKEMKSCFWVSGYPDNLTKKEMGKVCFSESTRSKSKSQESKGVSLIITFYPKFKSIGQLSNKHLHILYMNQETKNIFTPGPIATFRSARKLSSYLVRARLYPIEQIVGSRKCKGKRCEVCLNVQETSCFTSSVTNKTYKINHQFECNEKCLVYLLIAKNV